MPVNDNKPNQSDAIVTDIFNTFLRAFSDAPSEGKPSAAAVDPVAEANRLLKKAEESADNATPSYTAALLEIADRHIRIIDLALSTQR